MLHQGNGIEVSTGRGGGRFHFSIRNCWIVFRIIALAPHFVPPITIGFFLIEPGPEGTSESLSLASLPIANIVDTTIVVDVGKVSTSSSHRTLESPLLVDRRQTKHGTGGLTLPMETIGQRWISGRGCWWRWRPGCFQVTTIGPVRESGHKTNCSRSFLALLWRRWWGYLNRRGSK